jgi:hypothetical protein
MLSKFAVLWSVVCGLTDHLRFSNFSVIQLEIPSFSRMLECLLVVGSAKFWEEQIFPVFKSDAYKLLKCKNIPVPANELHHSTKFLNLKHQKSNMFFTHKTHKNSSQHVGSSVLIVKKLYCNYYIVYYIVIYNCLVYSIRTIGVWGSVVVKALRY